MQNGVLMMLWLEMALVTVSICTLGGAATILPQLKEVREEMKSWA